MEKKLAIRGIRPYNGEKLWSKTNRRYAVSRVQKILLTLLAMTAFVLVSCGFFGVIRGYLSQRKETSEYRTVYHHPTESAVPETVPATQPPETEAAETLPEETEPVETEPAETEPAVERIWYDQVPLYDQTCYSAIRYGTGDISTSGSNIVSLAMVASYLTGHEYMPDYLAACFADYIGNSMQWLEHASDELQLPWKKAVNIDETIQALREGKVAVVLMNAKSLFMETQHFVVFTGITEGDKILIHDPYGPNYEKWNLENALVNGFRRSDLTGGYGGAWIYDPEEMPEVPFVYEMAENTDVFRYGDLELSEADRELIVKLICMEGESEPFEGQQAIAEVILNRVVADNFPDTVSGVIQAPEQFQAADRLYLAKPTHTQYEAVERALNGPYVLDGDVVFFSQYAVNSNVWGTIGNHIFCRQW